MIPKGQVQKYRNLPLLKGEVDEETSPQLS